MSTPKFIVGDRVRIPASAGASTGRVVELLGPLGPRGCEVYTVRFDHSGRKGSFIEVREDQIVAEPEPTQPVYVDLSDPVRAALAELVAVKDLKDREGKTAEYERRQPLAWANARAVLAVANGGAS